MSQKETCEQWMENVIASIESMDLESIASMGDGALRRMAAVASAARKRVADIVKTYDAKDTAHNPLYAGRARNYFILERMVADAIVESEDFRRAEAYHKAYQILKPVYNAIQSTIALIALQNIFDRDGMPSTREGFESVMRRAKMLDETGLNHRLKGCYQFYALEAVRRGLMTFDEAKSIQPLPMDDYDPAKVGGRINFVYDVGQSE
jgi:hypothetical protein